MGAPRIISLHTILGPPDHFLRLLYGAPQISFFSYNMGSPLRSVSLFTICPPPPHPSDQFLCMLYGGPPHILVVSQNIWGPPQISFSTYYMGPPEVSFFACYMGSPQISFCAYFLGPFSNSFFFYMGPLQISFFAYYMEGGALRSVSSLTVWRPPSGQFLRLLCGAPSD